MRLAQLNPPEEGRDERHLTGQGSGEQGKTSVEMVKEDRTGAVETENVHGVSPFVLGVLDLFLLNAAFFSLNYWKRGTLDLSPIYVKLLFAFYGLWFVVSLSTKKFRLSEYQGLTRGLWTLARSSIYLAYCMAAMVVLLGLYAYSRGHIFGTCLTFVGLECLLFSAVHFLFLRPAAGYSKQQRLLVMWPSNISWGLLSIDFVLVTVSFFIVNYFKRGGFHLLSDYEAVLVLFYGVWFVSSIMTRKFVNLPYPNLYHALWPWLKSAIMMAFVLAILVYVAHLFRFSRSQVFGPIVVLAVLEFLVYGTYFAGKTQRGSRVLGDVESADEAWKILQQSRLEQKPDFEKIRQSFFIPVSQCLKEEYLRDDERFLDFIENTIDLSGLVRMEMAFRNTTALVHLNRPGDRPVRLFVNHHKINDIRRINRYFLEVHSMLVNGGYFVGRAHTISTHRNYIYRRYPRQIANWVYVFDFFWHRVCPILPWIKNSYFAFTKGKGRIISRAEVLGRLSFCGFKIVAEKEIDERLYFAVQKVLTPSQNQNPSYGPLVEMNRVGSNGHALSIYKLRTMYPYSEFIQDYVYEKQGLQKGGKLEEDFRTTGWGKVMRKLWLDELPMLYNWVRGDLKLFGVRPLSPHYLSLYPKDLQELRTRVKPGLIPPFYADMPETFEEICESERRYIEQYLKAPLRTQWVYFWKAFWNIVFRGARSH